MKQVVGQPMLQVGRQLGRIALALSVAWGFAAVVAPSLPGAGPVFVPAAEAQGGRRGNESEGEGQAVVSKEVAEAYNAALAALEAGNEAEAVRILRAALARDISPEERAILLKLLANIEIQRENYEEALRLLQERIKTGALTEADLTEAYFFLGSLYVVTGDYRNGIKYLEQYMARDPNPPHTAHYLLAQAYAGIEDWENVIPQARLALQKVEEAREGYYRLLLAAYVELRRYRDAIPLLKTMIGLWPKKNEYYLQLAASYQNINDEREAFNIQVLRYEQGLMTKESELVLLADVYNFYEYPYKAAQVLSREMNRGRVSKTSEHWEKLGNFWLTAKEYAEAREALKNAAATSGDGDIDFQIGSAYVQDEQWEQGIVYLRRALNKGGLGNNTSTAWFLLAYAQQSLGQRKEALESFQRARDTARTGQQREDAATWISFLESQIAVERSNLITRVGNKLLDLITRYRPDFDDAQLVLDIAKEAKRLATNAAEAEPGIARDRILEEYAIRQAEVKRLLEALNERLVSAKEDTEEVLASVDQIENPPDEIPRRATELATIVTTMETNLAEAQELLTQAEAIVAGL